MSIRLRLNLTFTACLLLATVIICGVVFVYVKNAEERAFHALAVSQLERVEERVKTALEPGVKSALYLASRDIIKQSRGLLNSYLDSTGPTTLYYHSYTSHARLIYDGLDRVARSNADFALIFMANVDGQYLQAPEGLSKASGFDPRQTPWYKDAMAQDGDLVFTAPYITAEAEKACSILVKTYDDYGRPLGVVGIEYNLRTLLAALDERKILDTGYLLVMDAAGRVLSDKKVAPRSNGRMENFATLWKNITPRQKNSFLAIAPDGTEKYVVTHTLTNLGWKISVIFSQEELMASSYRILRIMLLTSLAVIACTIAVGSMLARSIVHPMEQLVAASTIISSGEHERSAEVRTRLEGLLAVKGKGEVRDLSVALIAVIKTLEQRIKDATQASKAKSDFLANISHEIRTPMNAIMGFTHFLLKSELTPKQRGYAEKVYNSTKALLGIIADILDFSHLENGSMTTEHTAFSLDRVLAELRKAFAQQSAEKQIPLQINIAPETPRHLTGDANRLHQVLVSLVENAFKFTEAGTVTVEVSPAPSAPPEDGTDASPALRPAHEVTLHFKVADTGIGMSEEQITTAFTAFSQVDASSTREYGGIGLGLAITRSLVRLMGGDINITSEISQGTSVEFTCKFKLDVNKDAAAESDATAESEAGPEQYADLKGFRVLLVEDNELNIIIAEEFLHEVGIETTTAMNGQEGIARIEEAFKDGHRPPFDLVLMDLQMPIMDGYEAAKRLRYNPDYNDMPIVAMTAHAMEDERQRCLDCGMNEHLTKPINVMELYATLRHFLVRNAKQAQGNQT